MGFQKLIAITGFMGCGKSEVARSLAQRLKTEMSDLDELITQSVGRTPAQLIEQEGECAFREIETNTLVGLLRSKSSGVIALGGGAWIERANRALLRRVDAISVWLDTPLEICWERIVNSSENRPLGKTKEQATELYERRLPIYRLADIRVEVTANAEAENLAARIIDEILETGDPKQGK